MVSIRISEISACMVSVSKGFTFEIIIPLLLNDTENLKYKQINIDRVLAVRKVFCE